jgi:hypothetical protein
MLDSLVNIVTFLSLMIYQLIIGIRGRIGLNVCQSVTMVVDIDIENAAAPATWITVLKHYRLYESVQSIYAVIKRFVGKRIFFLKLFYKEDLTYFVVKVLNARINFVLKRILNGVSGQLATNHVATANNTLTRNAQN